MAVCSSIRFLQWWIWSKWPVFINRSCRSLGFSDCRICGGDEVGFIINDIWYGVIHFLAVFSHLRVLMHLKFVSSRNVKPLHEIALMQHIHPQSGYSKVSAHLTVLTTSSLSLSHWSCHVLFKTTSDWEIHLPASLIPHTLARCWLLNFCYAMFFHVQVWPVVLTSWFHLLCISLCFCNSRRFCMTSSVQGYTFGPPWTEKLSLSMELIDAMVSSYDVLLISYLVHKEKASVSCTVVQYAWFLDSLEISIFSFCWCYV